LTTTDFTYLLNNPDAVTEKQMMELERVLSEFPYFQSAGAIRLKGLFNQNSFRYNLELKKLASQTTDRMVLFDFITSENFGGKTKDIHEIEVFDTEIVPTQWVSTQEKLQQSIRTSIKSSQTEGETEIETDPKTKNETSEPQPEESLGVGKPIEFSNSDKFSFTQWLQLTKAKPIKREETSDKKEEEKLKLSDEKLKKIEIIDKFIETNPKIIPSKDAPINPILDIKPLDNTTLMTETLAKVYLEQKKYQKAIEAYEILILKYPEKSVFFADRIENIKKLQQNNI